MKELDHSQLPTYGISTKHSMMDNGERRFRLIGADGSCYIRTEASENSGWENSHSHSRLTEICIVQRGWVVYAELVDGRVEAKRYEEGETFRIPPMIPHNAYLSPNGILHTVKFGDCTNADWIPSPELDALLKNTDPNSHISA